MNQSMKK